MKKIGIFAGTFDPVHNGHLAFAQKALELGLDMVYFLPEPRPRRKQGVRALEHRQAMINLAIQDNAKLGLIRLEQARFSVHETLPVLFERFPTAEITLLFGDDVIKHIVEWPHIEELVDGVSLLIAVREEQAEVTIRHFETLAQVSGLHFNFEITSVPLVTVSSSKIRRELKRSSDVAQAALSEGVARYISDNGLYSESSRTVQ